MKITMQEFEAFEKQFVSDVLGAPDYRLGQAFSNTFPEIVNDLSGGPIGYRKQLWLWETRSRDRVLELIDEYIIK